MGDVQQQQQNLVHTFKKIELPTNSSLQSLQSSSETTNPINPHIQAIEQAKQANRCFVCDKDLGLITITCKCKAVTCLKHKYPKHDCTFDYQTAAAERIKADNPKVTADKITRI